MNSNTVCAPSPLASCLTGADWMSSILDQLDYGLLVVDGTRTVHYANGIAGRTLEAGTGPLHLLAGAIQARHRKDALALFDAIEQACCRGLRALLSLGEGPEALALAVVPIRPSAPGAPPLALLVTGRMQVCETLTARMFALVHGLTYAETRVLELLCTEATPGSIARQLKVALSTVRTQISSIRAKTGTPTIGALVRQIALLPPLVIAWRYGPGAA